jgi:hypothetical protein
LNSLSPTLTAELPPDAELDDPPLELAGVLDAAGVLELEPPPLLLELELPQAARARTAGTKHRAIRR